MRTETNGSARGLEVLEGMWAGKGMKEIAADLGISAKTVEYHRAQLYRVFGVRDPVSLCRRGVAAGLLGSEGSRWPGGRNGRNGKNGMC